MPQRWPFHWFGCMRAYRIECWRSPSLLQSNRLDDKTGTKYHENYFRPKFQWDFFHRATLLCDQSTPTGLALWPVHCESPLIFVWLHSEYSLSCFARRRIHCSLATISKRMNRINRLVGMESQHRNGQIWNANGLMYFLISCTWINNEIHVWILRNGVHSKDTTRDDGLILSGGFEPFKLTTISSHCWLPFVRRCAWVSRSMINSHRSPGNHLHPFSVRITSV